jgi:hypothetical protein
MEEPVQGLEGVFVPFQPEIEFIVFVRNNPYGFTDTVGYLLGAGIRKIMVLSGDEGTAVSVTAYFADVGRYGDQEDEKIRIAASHRKGMPRFQGVDIPFPDKGVLILNKKVQHQGPRIIINILGLIPVAIGTGPGALVGGITCQSRAVIRKLPGGGGG